MRSEIKGGQQQVVASDRSKCVKAQHTKSGHEGLSGLPCGVFGHYILQRLPFAALSELRRPYMYITKTTLRTHILVYI